MNTYQERLPCGRLIWAFRDFNPRPKKFQPVSTTLEDPEEQRYVDLGQILAHCEAINLQLASEVLNTSIRQIRRLIAGGKLERAAKGKVKSESVREWISSGQARSVAKEKRT